MKKKILLSAAVAVMLVAALAATALAGTITISGPGSVKTGETITITVSTGEPGASGYVETEGLEVTGVGAGGSTEEMLLLWNGTQSVDYTCVVTANSGTVSFSLSGAVTSAGEQDVSASVNAWTATVASSGGDEPTDQPTGGQPTDQPTGDQPSGQPSGSATGSATGGNSSSKPDNMPKTGDATMDLWTLTIIAGACAVVAILAGKKAFANR